MIHRICFCTGSVLPTASAHACDDNNRKGDHVVGSSRHNLFPHLNLDRSRRETHANQNALTLYARQLYTMILGKYHLIYFAVNLAWFSTCDVFSKEPTVLIAILVRNKAHTLPYFLSLLERQDYPKKRICLW